MELEKLILSSIVYNEDYARKVIPYLKKEYFSQSTIQLYELVANFFNKYNKSPTKDILNIELENLPLVQSDYDELKKTISDFKKPDVSEEWLVTSTEKFCQDKAIHNAILETIQIYDGKSQKAVGSIPELLSDALSISFDTKIGMDYFDDAEAAFDSYSEEIHAIHTGMFMLDSVMNEGAGPERGSLNCVLAETGGGKSIFLCNIAANALLAGKNVLYLTLELSEKMLRKRIDANLIDTPIGEVKRLPKKIFLDKISKLPKTGKLKIKQFPPTSVHSGHFRYLLQELKLKQNFIPDVIVVDYINLMASSRFKPGAVNSYGFIKAIAEELRGLMIEFNVVGWTATQVNRAGYGNSDMDLTSTSESMGLPMTLDSMFAIISTEELQTAGQILMKQLKNRFGDLNYRNKFIMGLDKAKMRFYDVDNPKDDVAVFDTSTIGDTLNHEEKRTNKFTNLKF